MDVQRAENCGRAAQFHNYWVGWGFGGILFSGVFGVTGWRIDISSSVELMEDLKENIYKICFPE